MESIKDITPFLNLIPLCLVFFMWTKFDKLWTAVDNKTSKNHADDTFQRKDLCDQTVETVKGDLAEIKADVKTLLARQV